jgi:hypothetical protein
LALRGGNDFLPTALQAFRQVVRPALLIARQATFGLLELKVIVMFFQKTISDGRRIALRNDADIGAIDVPVVEEDNVHVNPLGAKAIGEIDKLR